MGVPLIALSIAKARGKKKEEACLLSDYAQL